MLRCVVLVKADVLIFHTLLWLLVTANVIPSSPNLLALMMEVKRSSETSVLK
jgi:hypothetical protein